MVLIFGAPVAHVMVIKFSRLLIGQSGPHKTWSSGKGREPAFRQETGRVCSASDGKPFIRAGVLWPEGQAGPLCVVVSAGDSQDSGSVRVVCVHKGQKVTLKGTGEASERRGGVLPRVWSPQVTALRGERPGNCCPLGEVACRMDCF